MFDDDVWTKLAEEAWRHCSRTDPKLTTLDKQQLLRKYNKCAIIPIDMVKLKLKLAAFWKLKTGHISKSVCMECLKKSKDIVPVLPKFPCLWDSQDLNFEDDEVRARCFGLLLVWYNCRDGPKITMDELRSKLSYFHSNREMCPCSGEHKVTKEPVQTTVTECLDSSADNQEVTREPVYVSNTENPGSSGDNHEVIQEPVNVTEIVRQDEEKGEEKVKKIYVQQDDWLRLLNEFPCLWDSRVSVSNNFRAMKREQLLAKYNEMSIIQITMEELRVKLNNYRQSQRRKKVTNVPVPVTVTTTECLGSLGDEQEVTKEPVSVTKIACQYEETFGQKVKKINILKDDWIRLVNKFPCLWDSQIIASVAYKAASREQLLEEYNEMSITQITMAELRVRMKSYRRLQRRQKVTKVPVHVTTTACLGSLGDNQEVTKEPINVIKIASQDEEKFGQKVKKIHIRNDDWLRLVNKFPCLWDSQITASVAYKAASREQLLEEYNEMSITQITMAELRVRMKSYRQSQRRQKVTKVPVHVTTTACLGSLGDNQEVTKEPVNVIKIASQDEEKFGQKVKKIHIRNDDWLRLVNKFPCLWDSQITASVAYKAASREQLLEEYNEMSITQITMVELRVLLNSYRQLQWRQKKNTKGGVNSNDHMSESEQMDSQDVNDDVSIHDEEQLVQKHNGISSVTIDMNKINKRIITTALREKDSDASKSGQSTPKVVVVIPCLLAPNDRHHMDDDHNDELTMSDQNQLKELPSVQIDEIQAEIQSRQNRAPMDNPINDPCSQIPQRLHLRDVTLKSLASFIQSIDARSRQQPLDNNASASAPTVGITAGELSGQDDASDSLTEVTSRSTPQIAQMLKEFPVLWDLQDLNYRNHTLKSRAREQLLEKYNASASVKINMAELKRSLINVFQILRRKGIRNLKSGSKSSARWAELLKEFPCLWDPQDLNYRNITLKSRAREQLLEKYNAVSSIQIDMTQLKKKIRCYMNVLYRQGIQRSLKATRMADLIKEFPCLWDPQDLNFRNITLKSRAREQLLEKYNAVSSIQIDMTQLKKKIRCYMNVRCRQGIQRSLKATRMADLIKEFPCLWDPQDLNYRDNTLKSRVRKQLLKKYNAVSSIQIDMTQLKKNIRCYMNMRHRQGIQRNEKATRRADLIKEFPCLWDPQDPNYRCIKLKSRAREQLLEKYNAVSSIQIDMTQLKKNIKCYMNVRHRQGIQRNGKATRMADLIKEFPCLWDPQDPNYRCIKLKSHAREQLLEKYNAVSSIQIDMTHLKKNIRCYMIMRHRQGIQHIGKATRMADLIKEFPCLWDPQDPNYRCIKLKSRAREQLLGKYNAVSSIQIDMTQLKKNIRCYMNMRYRHGIQRSLKATRMADLIKEFPCLWDPQDLNYRDNTLKSRAREQLLEKYNAVSSIQIDMTQLKKNIKCYMNMRYRQGIQRNVKATRMADLIEEFPCFWDPRDLNYRDFTLKSRAREQLLEKYNASARVKINMAELKKKLDVANRKRLKIKKRQELRAGVTSENRSVGVLSLDHSDHSSSHDPTEATQVTSEVPDELQGPSEVHKTQCSTRREAGSLSSPHRVCGLEASLPIDTPHVENTSLALNGHASDRLQKTDCRNCNTKDDLNITNINEVKDEATSDNESDYEIEIKEEIDDVTAMDTEFVRQAVDTYVQKLGEKKSCIVDIALKPSSKAENSNISANNDIIITEAETEMELVKQTVFRDPNTGVSIDIFKRIAKSNECGDPGGFIDVQSRPPRRTVQLDIKDLLQSGKR